MKREQLRELGLTDEQIEKVMAENGKDVQNANSKAEQYKNDASRLAEVQKRLEDLQNANLSDIEKANKETEEALKRVAELEKREALGNSRKMAMENFKITSEQASQVVKDDGTLDYETLGKIIAEKEIASATAKEQEIANNSFNPNGGNGGSDKTEKSEVEKIAETIGKSISATNEQSKTVIDSYL